MIYLTLILFLFTVYFMSNKLVSSDHLSYVTIFYCSLGRSHKTGLTVFYRKHIIKAVFRSVNQKHVIRKITDDLASDLIT